MSDDASLLHESIDLLKNRQPAGELLGFERINHRFLYDFDELLRLLLTDHIAAVILQRKNRIDIGIKEIARRSLMEVNKNLEEIFSHFKALIRIEFHPDHRCDRCRFALRETCHQCIFHLSNQLFGIFKLGVDIHCSIDIDLCGIKLRKELKLGDLHHPCGC